MVDFLPFGNRIWKLNMEAGLENDSWFLIALNREIRYLIFCLESYSFAAK